MVFDVRGGFLTKTCLWERPLREAYPRYTVSPRLLQSVSPPGGGGGRRRGGGGPATALTSPGGGLLPSRLRNRSAIRSNGTCGHRGHFAFSVGVKTQTGTRHFGTGDPAPAPPGPPKHDGGCGGFAHALQSLFTLTIERTLRGIIKSTS